MSFASWRNSGYGTSPKRDITAKSEHATSGWDRKSMRRCWEFLDMTSRSFAAVIKELDGDLARVVRSRCEEEYLRGLSFHRFVCFILSFAVWIPVKTT